MSDIANWSYTAKATVWRVIDEDEYGKKVFSNPEIIMCDYGLDAQAKLGNIGMEFVIKNTFWTEYSLAKKGDYILLGEHSELNPVKAGAEEIRHIIQYADTFERLADDFAIITAV